MLETGRARATVRTLTKAQRTRQRILDAAAKVFREQGYANARLVDIAELAGIQGGSLYYHFEGREELVAEVLRLGIAITWQHVKDALDALPPDASALDRVETMIRAHLLCQLEISDYASAQARIAGQVPPHILRAHQADQRRYGARWHTALEAAMKAGQIRSDLDAFTARMLILGALNWTAEWYRPKRGRPATAVAEDAVALLIDGLRART